MGKFYASQQPNKATNNSLECGRYELEDFCVVHEWVEQTRHQHTDHSNDDHTQGEADHQGHKERKF